MGQARAGPSYFGLDGVSRVCEPIVTEKRRNWKLIPLGARFLVADGLRGSGIGRIGVSGVPAWTLSERLVILQVGWKRSGNRLGTRQSDTEPRPRHPGEGRPLCFLAVDDPDR